METYTKYRNELLFLFIGAIIGSITEKNNDIFLIVGSIGAIGVLAELWISRKLKQRRIRISTKEIEEIWRPDKSTIKFAKEQNDSFRIINKAIEVWIHGSIDTESPLHQKGMEPKDLNLKILDDPFDVLKLFKQTNLPEKHFDVDKTKYSLTSIPQGDKFDDSGVMYFFLKRTKFSVVQSFKEFFKSSLSNRLKYGSIRPSENQVPNIMCLHFLTEFSDGHVLFSVRADGLEYYDGLISISAEEQLSVIDVFKNKNAELWFQRAILEELFPMTVDEIDEDDEEQVLEKVIDTERRWLKLSKRLKIDYRYWSIILEEELVNFSIMGFVRLGVSIKQYQQLYKDLLLELDGDRDKEGTFYFVHFSDLDKLLTSGQCQVHGLFSMKRNTIELDQLHPTSLYRVVRYLRAKTRSPIKVK